MGIYLDNAATSYPKPQKVIESMTNFMMDIGATSGRGAYETAIQSDMLVYQVRKGITDLFHFNDVKKVIFTLNATESLNVALKGILNKGDHVITSSIEHNAVWRCLKTLERDIGITISVVSCSKEGFTNPFEVENAICEDTALVVFNHASNVLGTLQPIKEIGEICRKYEIPFLVDAAQTAGVYPIDVIDNNINLLAFTGHKGLLGPMGTGGLVINWKGDIKPIKSGGTGGDSTYEYQPDYYPNRLESGTLNVPGIVGLGEGIKYIQKVGVNKIYHKEKELLEYAFNQLHEIEGITVYGPQDSEKIIGVISFNLKDKSCDEVAYKLGRQFGIMIRAGLHCAPTAHEIIGTKTTGTCRIGIGYFNEKKDIDFLIEALQKINK
ncbi:cysteine desulfurase family protein [Alkalibaculum bacchi]|uniref:cysteine desulfurase n=1 Tax=Alkalibaculum bacchi TaxID=645887 RepID=A0A366I2B4_9FIRM|nr:aminotransferase class V-fold PLP-dependent enzyme [Alkalibaculum bacchi]RBP61090.1 cysteine desulfurase family protein [Alkalibaculum bacchi]